MRNLVLVHGAWHDIWCWDPLLPYITKHFNVVTIRLPGRAIEASEHFQEINLNSYVEHIIEQTSNINGTMTVLGHSMAGLIITQLAARIPHKISNLIYLAAFVPNNGECLFDITKNIKEPGISSEFTIDKQANYIKINASKITQTLFLNKTSPLLAEQTLAQLCPEPFKAFVEPVQCSSKDIDPIPKLYIKCLDDQAILPYLQDVMIDRLAKCKVLELDADHSPFLSCPEQLAGTLITYCT